MKKRIVLMVAILFAAVAIGIRGLVEGFTSELLFQGLFATLIFCLFFFTIGVKLIAWLTRKSQR